MDIKNYKDVLVIRNDKLGDFITSLPAIACIKINSPHTRIHVLVSEYVTDAAECSTYIDSVIVDPGRENGFRATLELSKILKSIHFDAIVTLFSTTHVGMAAWLARIPYRLAPATKLAQLTYNNRLKQRRSQSVKPEHEYNLDLAIKFLDDVGVSKIKLPAPPYLSIDTNKLEKARSEFFARNNLSESTRLIFIHAGSGGSSNNLSITQYAELIRLLNVADPFHIVLSAGPDELDYVNQLSGLISSISHTIYESTEGLRKFIENVALADLFIGGSTGPLHIAGALDVPTAAFYVRLRTSSALRWKTVNSPDKRLSFSPEDSYEEEDMSGVDLENAAKKIKSVFLI